MKFITENLTEIKDIIEYCNVEVPDYYKNIEEIKHNKNIVILGNFDGVHKGHQVILQKAVERAKDKGLKTIVYTFSEYPKNQQTKITTCSEKAYFLDKNKIDYLCLEQFEKVRNYSPEEFVEKVIVQKAVLDVDGEIISSTRIRNYIKEGNFEKVRELLGHNFIILGEVVYGKQLGRVIGFPTANLKFENKIYPEFGVYGVKIHIQGDKKIYNGVMNIGRNPTVNVGVLSVETNIFDFNEDIYGKIILIEVLENIRYEKKFSSVEKLKEQIGKDASYWKNKIDKYQKEKENR